MRANVGEHMRANVGGWTKLLAVPSRPRWLAVISSAVLLALPSSAMAEDVSQSHLVASEEHLPVLTREAALTRFQRENLQLEAARLGLTGARADVLAAGVLPNPTLSVNGSKLVSGAPTGADLALNVVVDQVVPLAGQVGLRKEVAEGYLSAAEREFAASAWQLMGEVETSYLEAQLAHAKVALLQQGLADFEKSLEIIAERTRAGANASYDVVRSQVERSELVSAVAEARIEWQRARSNLALSIGRSTDPAQIRVDDQVVEASPPDTAVEQLVERALRQRQENAAAELRASASRARIGQIKREYVPSPDLSIGYSPWFNVPGTGGANGSALYAGISVPLPIFDHGQGKIERAASEADASSVQARITRRAIELEVRRAYDALTLREGTWRQFRDQTRDQVERLRTVAESSYREGKSGILELLDAHRAYMGARQREIELRGAAAQASLELRHAVGPATRGSR